VQGLCQLVGWLEKVFLGDATPTYGGLWRCRGFCVVGRGGIPDGSLNFFPRVRCAYPGYAGMRRMQTVSRVFVGDATPTYGGVGIDLASGLPDRRELTVDVINAHRYYQCE